MPLYEYKCEKCGHTFEKLIHASESLDNLSCPECHSKKVSRQISKFSTGKEKHSCPTCSGICKTCS